MASTSGESSASGEELEPRGEPKAKISEYEKQRLSRIAENKARLEALGIFNSVKALPLGPSPNSRKRREIRNSVEGDDDYKPDGGEDDDEEDEDEEFVGSSTFKRKNKASSTSKRKVLSKKNLNRSDPIGDNDTDDDLEKAISLSLQGSVTEGSSTTPSKKMRSYEESASWKKKKKPELMSKMQMTDDELVIYFYQFDETGKGFMTMRDVAKMARVHDFTWNEDELQDMIRCFDLDKDGKLSLDEFRKIVTRCRMLKES